MLAGCGGTTHAHTVSVSRIRGKPSTPSVHATIRVISLDTASHQAPPVGVKAQLEWIVGGGSSFQADCSGQAASSPSGSPKIEFSRLPYNGVSDGASAHPLLGESFAACVTGFRPSELVELTLTRADGRTVSTRAAMPSPPKASTPLPAEALTWYPPLRPWDPPGRYSVRAERGAMRASAVFDALPSRTPAFRAARFFGRPGDTFPFYVVGLQPNQRVTFALYRQSSSSSSATFVAYGQASAGMNGTVVYLVRTSSSDSQMSCYGADVHVDGRALNGAGGVGEFCLQPEDR
jgi:hypothetical protein